MEEQQQYLFIDFEFTMPEGRGNPAGFYPEIIEVGFVSVIGDSIQEQFSSFVIPKKFPKLTERCKKFLNIGQSQMESGISFEELVTVLKKVDTDYPTTVVTWGNMDMKVLKQNCQ